LQRDQHVPHGLIEAADHPNLASASPRCEPESLLVQSATAPDPGSDEEPTMVVAARS